MLEEQVGRAGDCHHQVGLRVEALLREGLLHREVRVDHAVRHARRTGVGEHAVHLRELQAQAVAGLIIEHAARAAALALEGELEVGDVVVEDRDRVARVPVDQFLLAFALTDRHLRGDLGRRRSSDGGKVLHHRGRSLRLLLRAGNRQQAYRCQQP